MNACKKCGSIDFDVESKNFGEDLHKIMQVFICKKCGDKETKLVDMQEG
ncbi:MAG: hypothetical protein PHF86_06735 [Candidatus Nanoarchaeia archaeon]|jgi:Zn finger protein HypA/HybF involved in hydrogenase expression|nr:hypothetical protein [Candidatus Nanoarchaeia archaeon]